MGQRGQRKARRRCAFVDVRTGLRCRLQVKKPGSKFCSHSHAARSRSRERLKTEPGSRKRYQMSLQAALDRMTEKMRTVADEMGKVPLLAMLPLLHEAFEERYQRGYIAATAKHRFRARNMRLIESKKAVDQFLGTRFGKGFITGDLRPEDLAKFKFGGGVNGVSG